jgi:hypothetical protein
MELHGEVEMLRRYLAGYPSIFLKWDGLRRTRLGGAPLGQRTRTHQRTNESPGGQAPLFAVITRRDSCSRFIPCSYVKGLCI